MMLVEAITQRLKGVYLTWNVHLFSLYWFVRARHALPLLALRQRDAVLEVGCGGGAWTAYLASRVARFVAIDIDSRRIAHARQWQHPWRAAPATAAADFMRASAVTLPYRDASFDAIISADVIEHIPDDAQAVREMARVLRPGGRAVLTTLLEDRPTYIQQMDFDTHEREYDAINFPRLFHEAGLEVVEVFYFYRALSTIARELEVMMVNALQTQPVVLRVLLSSAAKPLLYVVGVLETLLPFGKPGGIGVLAVKPVAVDSVDSVVPRERAFRQRTDQ